MEILLLSLERQLFSHLQHNRMSSSYQKCIQEIPILNLPISQFRDKSIAIHFAWEQRVKFILKMDNNMDKDRKLVKFNVVHLHN